MKRAVMQFGGQSVYAGIVDGTRTLFTDCILRADDDDWNVAHVTKPAETGVVGIDVGETQLTIKTENQQDGIQPVNKLPNTTTNKTSC